MADFSAFVHESVHIYLQTLNDIVEGGSAPAALQNDWQTLLDYAGVEWNELTEEQMAREPRPAAQVKVLNNHYSTDSV